jgi:hypothetical protein
VVAVVELLPHFFVVVEGVYPHSPPRFIAEVLLRLRIWALLGHWPSLS